MWAVIKIDIKKISTLKKDFFDKLGSDVEFYMPKLRLKKYSDREIIKIAKKILRITKKHKVKMILNVC